MDIKLKLHPPFVAAMNRMRDKYGEKFEHINGFHNMNLNFSDFIDNFVDSKTVADTTIDANANSSTHDIRTLLSDMVKPHTKLLAFNKIFYELTKKYGIATAEKWLDEEWSGATYLHDAPTSSFVPYCYAYDLDKVVEKGLFFINKFKTAAPKHLTTFNDHVLEFVSWASNRTSGAVGLPSYLLYSYYFWHNDTQNNFYLKDPEYYRRQCFQKFIYDLNQPYLRVTECAFSNISIMDRNYLIELFGGRQFPNGDFVIDHIDGIIEHQEVFMEVVAETRRETMMTFPVLTFSLLYQNGKFVDEDFARWCNRHNMEWYDSNFYVGSDVTSLSNCCFSGEQKTLTKSSNGVNYMTFKELYKSEYDDCKRNFTVFHNGSWVKGKIVKLSYRQLYKVKTSNNKEILVTDNHINVTLNGEKSTDKLTTSDYLMFNSIPLDTFPEQDDGLKYEDGFMIGMYLGDGSIQQQQESFTPTINLSLNSDKYLSSIKIIQDALKNRAINAEVVLNKQYNNVYPVSIRSTKLENFIRTYVNGNYSYEKELNLSCLLQSREFRQGILDGYYLTDGGNSNRIYTTSVKLSEQIETLITSLGMHSVIDISDRTDEKVIIRGEEFNRNYPTICIRWYDPKNKRSSGDVFRIKNNSTYFKIKSIEAYDSNDKFVYCFEMPDKEPYFTLPNGIITHNCRLISNTSKLDAFINSIGGTSLSVGSVKVNTINLRRIALEANKDKNKYIEILKSRLDTCIKTLDIVRSIIKRNIDKGLLPNYTFGLIELDKQYNTIGITAMYEALNDFGLIGCDEFGNKYYTDESMKFSKLILNTINEVKDSYSFDYSINVEAIPAERANVVLCSKDSELYKNNDEYYIYSNQWIPLMERCTIAEKIRLGSILDKECGGGQISHINLEGKFANEEQAWELLNRIAAAGVIYFAYNTKISICEDEHAFFGVVCPKDGKPMTDTYSRIVGFLVPTSSYSKERKAEFDKRNWFKIGQDL